MLPIAGNAYHSHVRLYDFLCEVVRNYGRGLDDRDWHVTKLEELKR